MEFEELGAEQVGAHASTFPVRMDVQIAMDATIPEDDTELTCESSTLVTEQVSAGSNVTSEGVQKSGANLWHASGWTGQGVKIAIFDGFNRYEEMQEIGELPKPADRGR